MTRTSELHEARTDLAEIIRLTADLPDEAITRGTTASEASDLLGNSANPDAWHQRIAYGWTPSPDNSDHHHPRWTLATWDRSIRHHHGHDARTVTPTMTTLAAYIGSHLSDLALATDFPFARLASDLNGCRRHLEAVLHDGDQTEHGAPCMDCKRPLRKTTLDTGHIRYDCLTCHRELNANEYALAVQAAHLKHADRLTAADLADRIEVSPSALRRWASVVRIQAPGKDAVELSPLLRSCGRDAKGRKVYYVAAALRIKAQGGDTRRTGATVSNDGAA